MLCGVAAHELWRGTTPTVVCTILYCGRNAILAPYRDCECFLRVNMKIMCSNSNTQQA